MAALDLEDITIEVKPSTGMISLQVNITVESSTCPDGWLVPTIPDRVVICTRIIHKLKTSNDDIRGS
ncbi:hypothetical protein ACHOLT_00355 [Desulfitobacterium sp. Sab5]|uniref:hypothetical protein n=1 Tax=Desulfitobacterium nosdiversum TaxID=3375356 RepID=UPI003CFA4FBB